MPSPSSVSQMPLAKVDQSHPLNIPDVDTDAPPPRSNMRRASTTNPATAGNAQPRRLSVSRWKSLNGRSSSCSNSPFRPQSECDTSKCTSVDLVKLLSEAQSEADNANILCLNLYRRNKGLQKNLNEAMERVIWLDNANSMLRQKFEEQITLLEARLDAANIYLQAKSEEHEEVQFERNELLGKMNLMKVEVPSHEAMERKRINQRSASFTKSLRDLMVNMRVSTASTGASSRSSSSTIAVSPDDLLWEGDEYSQV